MFSGPFAVRGFFLNLVEQRVIHLLFYDTGFNQKLTENA
jgi:hypothetical protein